MVVGSGALLGVLLRELRRNLILTLGIAAHSCSRAEYLDCEEEQTTAEQQIAT